MSEPFSITRLLLILFSLSLIIGGIDYLRGNPWKLGERFSAGFRRITITISGINSDMAMHYAVRKATLAECSVRAEPADQKVLQIKKPAMQSDLRKTN